MMPRGLIVFGAVLALGGMLPWAIPGVPGGALWWLAVLVAAAIGGLAASRARPVGERSSARAWLGKSEFLCDTCRDNHPDQCSRPERPNATRCPDYRSRG